MKGNLAYTERMVKEKLPWKLLFHDLFISLKAQVTQLVTSHLLHSLYNIILRLATFLQSVFTHINSAASNNKNNTNFYTKTR